MSTSVKLQTDKEKPLQGRRILLTRAAEQAAGFSAQLRIHGAVVVECPTIRLVPVLNWEEIDAAINSLSSFDWLILTSINAVRIFFGRIRELGLEITALNGCKVCAVGSKTAEEIDGFGILPDLVPEQFTGEGVVAAFEKLDLKGSKILFPKAEGARELIPIRLSNMGAVLHDPVLYRNIMPDSLPDEARDALEGHKLDAAIFSSPSTVRNLAVLVGGSEKLAFLFSDVAVASIGPVTSRACEELGLVVSVEPERATLEDLLASLERFYSLPARE